MSDPTPPQSSDEDPEDEIIWTTEDYESLEEIITQIMDLPDATLLKLLSNAMNESFSDLNFDLSTFIAAEVNGQGGGGPSPYPGTTSDGIHQLSRLVTEVQAKICGTSDGEWDYCGKRKKYNDPVKFVSTLAGFIVRLFPNVVIPIPAHLTGHLALYQAAVAGGATTIAIPPGTILAGASLAVLIVVMWFDGFCECDNTLGNRIREWVFSRLRW